jgi:NAD(P)-dependent dehydrogenase (short-subunit alcohol dehydrogenase family)
VFGASSGIGKAIAERCARDGDALILIARNPGKLADAARDVERAGARGVQCVATDLSNPQRVQDTLSELASLAPSPTRVLLNGGGPPFGRFTEITLDQWRRATQEALLSNVQILQSIVPRLTRGASVVAILSDVVHNAGPEKTLPCSLRLALLGTLKCLALQFAADGIRFNTVSPGPTDTNRARGLIDRRADDQGISRAEAYQQFADTLPMKRLASPEDVAAVAHFLLSHASANVSGANYSCDGGLTAPYV